MAGTGKRLSFVLSACSNITLVQRVLLWGIGVERANQTLFISFAFSKAELTQHWIFILPI